MNLKKIVGLGTAAVLGASGMLMGAITADAYAPNDVVAKYGQRNPSVKYMQQDLIKLGYMRAGLDTGYYGPITKDAVTRYQKMHKLPVTTTITAKLYVAIDTSANNMRTTKKVVAPKKSSSGADSIYVKYGQTSSRVRYMQEDLIKLGYMKTGLNTGYYGNITKDAVNRYQRAHKLRVTSDVTKRVHSLIDESAGTMSSGSRLGRVAGPTRTFKKAPSKTVTNVPKGVRIDSRCLTGARVLCVNKSAGKMYLVRNGKVVESFTVRTGRPSLPTREGSFKIFYKNKDARSSLYNNVPMPGFMAFSGGQGIHYSSEFAGQYAYAKAHGTSMPKYGSHGCVGLPIRSDSLRIYGIMHIGDKVVVYR